MTNGAERRHLLYRTRIICDPAANRTRNLQLRRLLLYPIELRGQAIQKLYLASPETDLLKESRFSGRPHSKIGTPSETGLPDVSTLGVSTLRLNVCYGFPEVRIFKFA